MSYLCSFQCFFNLPYLWKLISSQTKSVSPLLHSLLKLNLSYFRSRSTLDPSAFLSYLESAIQMTTNNPFTINQQHDAAEIFSYLLECTTATSPSVKALFNSIIMYKTHCLSCDQTFSSNEETPLIQVSVMHSTKESLKMFLQPFILERSNKYFCSNCKSFQNATRSTFFTRLGNALVIQLRRFSFVDNIPTKFDSFVPCWPPDLSVPDIDDEVALTTKLKLVAAVNHHDSLASEHYTAVVKRKGVWFSCDDTDLIACPSSSVSNQNCYILFHAKQLHSFKVAELGCQVSSLGHLGFTTPIARVKLWEAPEGGLSSLLDFSLRVDVPTYYPSHLLSPFPKFLAFVDNIWILLSTLAGSLAPAKYNIFPLARIFVLKELKSWCRLRTEDWIWV